MSGQERLNTKGVRKRAARAWKHREQWDHLLRDVYDYVIPYRNAGDHVAPGQKLNENVFDATAIDAAFRFAGRMQQNLTPPFQTFFELHVGPALAQREGPNKTKDLNEALEALSLQVHAALNTSAFHTAAPEMYLDLFAGTGAMLMLEGDTDQPIDVLSVPIYEIALELGPWGKVWGVHWRRAWPLEDVFATWPKGQFSERLRTKFKEDPNAEIPICQSTTWNRKTKRWVTTVFADDADARKDEETPEPAIWSEDHRANPWITPRFFVVPGETMGRGPALIAMPNIKTVNKAREYDLKAAAFALFGIFTAKDDGVFNPDTARFEPGAIWSVASNARGGAYGPSIDKLDVPGRYDLSRFITDDEREQINMMTFNRRLPPESGAVRSPTEILERIRDVDLDMAGSYGRLAMEIVEPVVERAIEILFNLQLINLPITIDQLGVGLRVVSPLARAQQTADAKSIVDYMTVVAGMFGAQDLGAAVRKDPTMRELGRMMGVAERFIPSEKEQQQFREQQAQAAAAELAAKSGALKGDGEDEPALNGSGAL